jgi:predicted transposase YbfD/YdcC
MESFCKSKEKLEIAKFFLGPEVTSPSHDTFERVFSLMEPREMTAITKFFLVSVFTSTRELLTAGDTDLRHICIDGKESRRSGRLRGTKREKRNNQTLHVYDATMGMCLESVPIEEKTNEIPMAQEILQNMDLRRTVVTFDAMNTQTKTIGIIADRGGWYVGGLKGNHKSLCEEAKYLFDETELEAARKQVKRHYEAPLEKAGGKIIHKQVSTMQVADGFFAEWQGLCTVVRYDRQAEDVNRGTKSAETRYYLSNMDADAKTLAQIITRHWEVETFHKNLDMLFADDENAVMNKQASCNLGIIKKMVLSLMKHLRAIKGAPYVADIRKKFLWDYKNTLMELLTYCDLPTLKHLLGDTTPAQS